jgi:hypothetical protein
MIPFAAALEATLEWHFGSPDNKMLAIMSDTYTSSEDDTVIRLLDRKDLTLQRQFKWQFLNENFPVSPAV